MMNKNMTIDNALELARKDWEEIFENQKETTMTENKEPDFNTVLVKKCLDIVRNNKKLRIREHLQIYTVYKWAFLDPWKDIFKIQNCTSGSKEYWLTINNIMHHIPMNTPGVKELYDTCAQKYYERTPQRENATLNFLDDYVAKKRENKVGFWQRLFNRQK